MSLNRDTEIIRVLAVSGSLREASYNRRLLELAQTLVESDSELADVEFTIFDGLGHVEPFNEDDELRDLPGVGAWRHAISNADAVFLATPEYNSSIPGQLKNALDWASRGPADATSSLQASVMYGKSAAVVSSSTGQFGGVWAADELRKSLKAQGARVVDSVTMSVGSVKTAFRDDGQLVSQDQQRRLLALIRALAEQVRFVQAAQARVVASQPA